MSGEKSEEIDGRVAEAFRRLDAKPGWTLRCWACGHEAEVRDDPRRSEYTCGECGAATCYGHPQPRIAIAPDVDRRFRKLKFQGLDPKGQAVAFDVTLANNYASAVAMEILSVTEPALYKAVQVLMLEKGGGAESGADDAVALDAVPGRKPVQTC